MFARNLAIRLKPNSLAEFARIFDNEVLPILRKQTGFRDEITFSNSLTGMDVVAISLWDTKEHAEAYNEAGYPEVLKTLSKVLDGAPRVRVSDVISSTVHQTTVTTA
jgi:heme-degrading monooxygenase HmoA